MDNAQAKSGRHRWLVVACVLVLFALAAVTTFAQGPDRRERRSQELALPDPYLDPSWPIDPAENAIDPEESDSVENVPLDDEALDEAEREEMERYKEMLGVVHPPDEAEADPLDERALAPEDDYEKEARDPVEW